MQTIESSIGPRGSSRSLPAASRREERRGPGRWRENVEALGKKVALATRTRLRCRESTMRRDATRDAGRGEDTAAAITFLDYTHKLDSTSQRRSRFTPIRGPPRVRGDSRRTSRRTRSTCRAVSRGRWRWWSPANFPATSPPCAYEFVTDDQGQDTGKVGVDGCPAITHLPPRSLATKIANAAHVASPKRRAEPSRAKARRVSLLLLLGNPLTARNRCCLSVGVARGARERGVL